jgi:hypothetical protein
VTPTTSFAPETGAAARPDLEGSLGDLPLPDLLDLLAATGKSGTISLGEPVGATLWVREGHLAYGSAPGAPDPGELLAAAGVVTPAQFDGAVTATSAHQSLSETLVDLFDADRAAIEAIAREQVITTVFEVLVVGSDHFAFHSGLPDPFGAPVPLTHAEILAEAERRRAQWQRIAELIPSTGIVAALSRELPGKKAGITITADEWQVLALLDGYRTVADVIAELGLSAFEVCGVLYELLRAGTVVVLGDEGDTDDEIIDVG